MKRFTDDLMTELVTGLQNISVLAENNLQRAEQSFRFAVGILKRLKVYISECGFQDNEEEIHFFKNIKPEFLKELIYFEELFQMESRKPVGSDKTVEYYYRGEISRVQHFFEINQYLYNYYLTKDTSFDNLFFSRKEEYSPLLIPYSYDISSEFSTPYSNIIAKMQAYEYLRNYLNDKINSTLQEQTEINSGNLTNRRLTWTDSKAALIELAYALYSNGSVNFGKGSFSKFIETLEALFNISLGNTSSTLISMSIRKKNRAAFLDRLKMSFENKLDERDK